MAITIFVIRYFLVAPDLGGSWRLLTARPAEMAGTFLCWDSAREPLAGRRARSRVATRPRPGPARASLWVLIDGTVLTQSIGPALAGGQFNRVPVINGTNRDEWRLVVAPEQLGGAPPVTAANYQASIASLLGVSAAAATAIAAEYPLSAYSSPPVALGAVGTDELFACPAMTV